MVRFLQWLVLILTLGLVDLRREEDDGEPVVDELPPGHETSGLDLDLSKLRTPRVPERYESSEEHLGHELAHADLFLRAQVLRWYLAEGRHKDAPEWGSGRIGLGELRRYLQSRFVPPGRRTKSLGGMREYRGLVRAAMRLREEVREAARRSNRSGLRLAELTDRLGLTPFDVDVLLAVLLPTLEGGYRRLVAVLSDDTGRTHPSPALVLETLHPVLAEASRDGTGRSELPARLLAARSLFYDDWPVLRRGVLELVPGTADEPLVARSLRLPERVVQFLLGDELLDPRLAAFVRVAEPVDVGEHDLPASLRGRLAELRPHLASLPPKSGLPLLDLFGPAGAGQVEAVCSLGCPALDVDLARLLEHEEPFAELVTAVYLEARLRGANVAWRGVDELEEEERGGLLHALVDAARDAACPPGHCVLTALVARRTLATHARRELAQAVHLHFPMPSVRRRRSLWRRRLDGVDVEDGGDLALELARAFQLTASGIDGALDAARTRSLGGPITREALFASCRDRAGRVLDDLATHVAPRPGADLREIVLPRAPKRQLEELLSRMKSRSLVLEEHGLDRRFRLGRGLLVLFHGTSGAGKTLAAEVLAGAAKLDLYRVDMSRVESKWVGEAQKNLGRVFDAARDSNAVLFFDEADWCFGRRHETKDARDRWANQEVNYLLQRIEEHEGIVILATNLTQNMDSAFRRRIQAEIHFPFPDAATRTDLWRHLLGSERVRVSDDQLAELGRRFALTGGSIRNAVVDAAFRVHERGGRHIRKCDLLPGVALELEKHRIPLSRKLFGGDYEHVLRALDRIPDPDREQDQVPQAW